jgi:hypothetical protein
MIAKIVYLLCALTSLACMGLLMRHYARTRLSLLFWSGAAFLLFALANIILFVDFVLVPERDLALWRNGTTLAGVVLLLYGLIRSKT